MGERERGYAHRIDVRAGPQEVWRALTDSGLLARWCSPGAEIHPRQGGSFRASIDRLTELEAHIDVFEPGRRMRLMYMRSAALPAGESVLVDDFMLEPMPGGTIVRLLGSGVPATPAWDTQYLRLRTGWQQAMTRLKVLLESEAQGAAP